MKALSVDLVYELNKAAKKSERKEKKNLYQNPDQFSA